MDDSKYKPYLPVAIICTSTTPSTSPPPDNPLLIYRINPPSDISVEKRQGQPTRLKWKLPDLGCDLKLTECLSSYRVFGLGKRGEELIGELILEAVPGSLRQLPGKVSLAISATQTEVELPAPSTAQYVALGLQSVDKALTHQGKQVMSDITWSPHVCTISLFPTPFEVTQGRQMVFDAKADYPPKGPRYRWFSTGRVVKDGLESAPIQFDNEGPARVTVTLVDAKGKELCSATATGRVKKKEARTPPEQPDVDKPPADKPPVAVRGVWRLVKRTVTHTDAEHHQYEIGQTQANCRNVHLEQNRILYQCRHTWSAPPGTIVPGQEYMMQFAAEMLIRPEDDDPGTFAMTICSSSFFAEVIALISKTHTAAMA